MANGVEFFCLVCGADFKLMVGGHMSPARPGYCSTKCRYASIAQAKRDAYERGEWMAPAPPVCHEGWNAVNWIAYIDKFGEWGPFDADEDTMDCKECGGDGCLDCMGEPEDCRFDTTQERDDFYAENG